jgi:copper chaperone
MLEFDIRSMSCGHCVGAVTQAVREIDPNARVDVDLPTHKVRVQSDQPRDKLVAALTEAGYPPA